MISFILLMAGLYSKVWSTISTSPLFFAIPTSSLASSEVLVIGFSMRTCFPLSSASLASEKCVSTGVAMTTARISGSPRISL